MMMSCLVHRQEGVACSGLVAHLQSRGINVHCSAITSTRIDFERHKPQLREVVRASVHYYNTEEEVEVVARAVAEAA